jgi:hypothetical protein
MENQRIDNTNFIDELRRAFPELEPRYQEIVKQWAPDEPGVYSLLGLILVPPLERELEKGEVNEFLRRCAAFIERVCSSGDPEAINVIWVRIFERLIYHPKQLDLLWPSLGTSTRENIRDAAQRWSKAAQQFGHTQNLPVDNLPKEE